mgnify:CR=1 FL=1
MPSAPQFILASGSPRRKQLLGDLGLSFDIQPADIDETPLKNEGAKDYVLRLSIEKAQAVAAQNAGQIVLAADTTVAVGRRILGKAENTEEATAMLRLMSGRRHRVYTAVAVIDKEGNVSKIKILESSGFKVLDNVSLKTLKKWKFTPARIGNEFVNDSLRIPVKFLLTN